MIYFIGAGPGAADLITVRGKEQFNKKMEDVLGGDTRSMYFGPSHLFEDYLIKRIMRNLNVKL